MVAIIIITKLLFIHYIKRYNTIIIITKHYLFTAYYLRYKIFINKYNN